MEESHSGTVLATIYALQWKWDELRKEVNELKKQRSARRKKLKAIAKEVTEEKARANAAEKKLQGVRDTLQQVEKERDEAQAAQQLAPERSIPLQPDQGTQEFEQLRARMSASAPAADVAKLRPQLQKAQAALTAQQGAVPESVLQTR